MRQINPLYISLLFFVVLLIVFIKLNGAKAEHNEAKNDLIKTEMMAKRMVALKRNWGEDKGRERALERMLKASLLRDAALVKKREGKMITVTSRKVDARALEFLLNKLFNGTYAIKTLDIRRLDDEYASLRMEIGL